VYDPRHTYEEDKKHDSPSLGLKTGGDGLVIWPTKSPRQFLGLRLKIKRRRFVGLHMKTDEQLKTM
jgi:hypothetical protein